MPRSKNPENHRNILKAAKKCFAGKGFEGTSIPDIADQAGISVGSIYNYFESKELLIQTILEEGWNTFLSSLLAQDRPSLSPPERLRNLVEIFFEHLTEDIDFTSIIFSEGLKYTNLEVKINRLVEFLSSLFAGYKTLPPEMLRAGLVIHITGVVSTLRLANQQHLEVTKEDIFHYFQAVLQEILPQIGEDTLREFSPEF